MATITGSAAEPAGTLTAPTVGGDTDTWGTILNETTLQALLNYALWFKLRVPVVAPTLEADGRILAVASGALVFADAASGGATAFTGLTDTPSAYTGEGQKLVRVNAGETALEFVAAGTGGDVTGPASSVDDRIATFDGLTGKILQDGGKTVAEAMKQSFVIAVSDESTALTAAGNPKVTFRMPYAFTLSAVRASVTTAPTGSVLTVDINEASTSILSTKLTIDATEKTSTTATTAAVISDTALADDAEITIDIDTIGSTAAGAGLKVYLIGVPA